VLRDHRNNPVGAELRGTTWRCWRGLAAGSQKDRGYFAIGKAGFQTTILCESAIDAISCFAIYSVNVSQPPARDPLPAGFLP
jgi:hypothetical protein